MTDDTGGITAALRAHLAVCSDLLALAQQESEALRNPAPYQATEMRGRRQKLLLQLESSWHDFAQQRAKWESTNSGGRDLGSGFSALLQTSLETIMRVLVLDRENEQHLLRRGLLPPQSLPASQREEPGFVAGLYQRHART